MKSQGLPITTIVLIVLGISVLAAVLIFFLGGFGQGSSSVNTFQCQQWCTTINTQIEAGMLDPDGFRNYKVVNDYCNNKCNNTMICNIPSKSGSWEIGHSGEKCFVDCSQDNKYKCR